MSFNRLAPHYDWMETVLAGRRLQRCRNAWIGELAGAENLLIAGVGHGPELPGLLRRFPRLKITGVDASARMLAVAAARLRRATVDAARVTFVHASLPAWRPPAGQFDAIATPFFLDCFPPEQLAEVIASLARGARPGARWLLSDFTVPERGWTRLRAQVVHALMYTFFRRVTALPARRLTPPDALLAAAGFRLTRRQTFNLGLLRADLWRQQA